VTCFAHSETRTISLLASLVARFTTALRRLRRLFARQTFERDLDHEMRFHFEMALAQRIAQGIDPTKARELTLKEFGSMPLYKDQVRDARGITISDDLWRDLRFGARALLRAPGFTLATVATIALGIGAGSAVLSLVNAVLLRPLPYAHADRLVGMWHSMNGLGIKSAKQAPGSYELYKESAKSFEAMGLYVSLAATITYNSPDVQPERVRAGWMTGSMFDLLGATPIVGRAFTDADGLPSSPQVVVISERMWREKFHSSPNVLDMSINAAGGLRRIIGVMPASFAFPERTVPIWIPLDPTVGQYVGGFGFDGIGRLRPGVSLATAQRELQQILTRLPERFPELRPGVSTMIGMKQTQLTPVLHHMRDDVVVGFDRILWLIAGAVGLLVIVAFSNVASLLLVRIEARRRDFAIRIALGASRVGVLRTLMAEATLIAFGGGAIGLGVAIIALRALTRMGKLDLPRVNEIHVDAALVVSAILLTCVFAAMSLVIGVLRVRSRDAMRVLRDGGRSGTGGRPAQRLRAAFVAVEVALSVVLLAASGVLGRSVVRLRAVQPGFDPTNVFTFWAPLTPSRYRTDAATARLYHELLDQIRTIPGVESAAASGKLPLEVEGFPYQVLVWADNGTDPAKLPPTYQVTSVTPEYFKAMRIPMLAGRTVNDENVSRGANETVVSRSFALRSWGDSTGLATIGQRLRVSANGQWFTIVGVVGDIRDSTLTLPPVGEVYVSQEPHAQETPNDDHTTGRDMGIVVRTTRPIPNIAKLVEQQLHSVDPNLPFYRPALMEQIVTDARSRMTFAVTLLMVGAGATLLLGVVGLYGVIAYVVSLRRREISIRIALGLEPDGATRMILVQGEVIVAVGATVGLALFLFFARLLKSLTFEVSAVDATTLGAAMITVLSIATLATWLPARRAARVDPAEALKSD
jgi:predicted permease